MTPPNTRREADGAAPARVVVIGGGAPDLAVIASVVVAHDLHLIPIALADAAPALIATHAPDAVIVDTSQPRTTGFAVCAQLRAHAATRGLPVILTGTVDSAAARRDADDCGADDYLVKPINRVQLAYRLRSFARLRRAWSGLDVAHRHLEVLGRFVQARSHSLGVDDASLRASCDSFGRYLDLDAHEVWSLRQAATLHDLGEIAVPEQVLNQRAALSAADRALIEHHPELGAAMLEHLPGCATLVEIVRHHHERWDGTGYPDRLAGEAIPKLARVLHILDVYDALTQRRAYQEARSGDEALAIMQADVGGFDPSLLARFAAWRQTHG
jgi:putative two-component system response regulator